MSECDDRECECACHGEFDEDFSEKFIPSEALLFETRDGNVFPHGSMVQLVGFGVALVDDGGVAWNGNNLAAMHDRNREHCVYLWCQAVHLEDTDGSDLDYYSESWRYFREDDLTPLTPAARRALALAERQNRIIDRQIERAEDRAQ